MELAILINKDTEVVLKRGKYPRKDMQLIEDLDPTLEWLLTTESEQPEYDSTLQKLERKERVTDTYHSVYIWLRLYEYYWNVVDKTDAELEADLEVIEEALDNKAVKRMLQRTADIVLADEENVTDQDIADAATLYQQWRVGILYEIGVKVAKGTVLFEVIQAHTSQADWQPEDVPALYKKFTPAGVISIWVQPTGSHDTYTTGDKVYFPTADDSVYESVIDNNSWSPTAYAAGWQIQ